ncbi:MAG: sugar O-acetyltransferase [Gammaproteobacteria bacterium]|nr:sugar O-acetyltransferase [Gammaproteobacteria bacterium]
MMEFDSLTKERIKQRHKVHEICRQFSRSPSRGNLIRLKELFLSCGEGVFIEQGFYCDYGDKISIGQRSYLNMNCTLLDGGLITIGDDCLIGPNVQILTINHDTSPQKRLSKKSYAEDIHIGNNVWIGAGVIILPGVNISEGAVIGAGSVVTKAVQEKCLYAGNPAKKIHSLEE